MLFCLAIHGIISSLSLHVKIAYLDDVTIIGNAEQIVSDFTTIKDMGTAIGLFPNAAKCELVSVQQSPITAETVARLEGVSVVKAEDAMLLGAPLGPNSLREVLQNHIKQLRIFQSRMALLQSHDAFFLLKSCLLLPKLLFTLRTAPCFEADDLLRAIDACIRDTLALVLNIDCDENAWSQASLPTRLGGLGIPSPSAISSATYLSSLRFTAELADRLAISRASNQSADTAVRHWTSLASCDLPPSHHQSSWTSPIYQRQHEQLLATSDERATARLHGCSARGASAWLSAVPIANLGLRMTNEQIRIAVALRLGANVTSTHPCVCGAQADRKGDHALSCKRSKARHARHRQLNDCISRAMTTAMIPNRLEPVGLLRDDARRPDGESLVPWSRGRCVAWDASCIHRLAASWIGRSTKTGTPAADVAELRKRAKYNDLPNEYSFEPVVCETMGGLGSTTITFLRQLGSRMKEANNDDYAFIHLMQRIGLIIQRGNAAAIMETFNTVTAF